MKADWEVKKLGEVCDFQGGAQPPKDEWIKNYKNGYVRMLQIRDFTQSRNFDIEYVKITNKLRRCTTDDILLGRYGASVGKVLTGLEGAYNVAILKTIPSEIIQKMYIKYYFLSPLFQIPLLNLCNQRAAQAGFNREDISDFPIPVPPLAEQKRIVEILDQKFAQIDQLKQNAEKNLQNAKELFQTELTKAFSNNTWEKKRLGDVCGITSKLVDPTQSEYLDLYHVGGANIVSETGKIIDLKTSKEESLSSSKFTFDNSMVLYNKIRPYLKKVARPNFSGLCSADMYPLSPKSSIEKDFLYYVLISKSFTDYAISKSDRAGMPKVNRDALFSFSFPLPPLSEQQKIVAHLDALQEKVRQLEEIYTKQIANCDELKQSFLKKAFEGEL